jgi:hypothetical protein
MKALTLHQPYATAIALGCKRIETRGWRTHYRGPLAIHAATHARPEYAAIVRDMPAAHAAAFVAAGYEVAGRPSLGKLPTACIVATADLVGCFGTDLFVPGDELFWGDYRADRFCWLLTNVRRLATPIPTRGYQGLWDWTPPAE